MVIHLLIIFFVILSAAKDLQVTFRCFASLSIRTSFSVTQSSGCASSYIQREITLPGVGKKSLAAIQVAEVMVGVGSDPPLPMCQNDFSP
jgi:hypothetical protein